jgi:REP element-mobilizing transposase RayT
MARAGRVDTQGAFYHLITRGNQRQKIFYDDQDRKKYLSLLRSLKEAYAFRLHAYVLMLNHVHLLSEAGRRSTLAEHVPTHALRAITMAVARGRSENKGCLGKGRQTAALNKWLSSGYQSGC